MFYQVCTSRNCGLDRHCAPTGTTTFRCDCDAGLTEIGGLCTGR